MKLLLSNGALAEALNYLADTPPHFVEISGHAPLHSAAMSGYTRIVELLLSLERCFN